VIEVEDLRKEYGELVAVSDLSFEARPGAIFGLLGPNGAGKSTAIGCISGLLTPTRGRIRVCGHDVVHDGLAARAQMGVVPQELALYEDLSAEENLAYWGAAYGLRGAPLRRGVQAVLERVGLADRAREVVKKLSGGMKRRLNFACGVLHQPKVLLLDEPTAGVDAQSRVRLLELVREQASAGTCVLYTTHYMEEAEALCDWLAIIDHGKLMAAGTLAELRGLIGERDMVRLSGRFDPAAVRHALLAVEGAEVLVADQGSATIALPAASRQLPDLFGALSSAGAEIRETTLTRPSLESLFIKLTGKELRE
jgi:ABC-2 type transport system ATP-binding protein